MSSLPLSCTKRSSVRVREGIIQVFVDNTDEEVFIEEAKVEESSEADGSMQGFLIGGIESGLIKKGFR